jgi:hypothetical protein
MELSQDERQKNFELIDKVSPCIAFSVKENLEMFKEWLDSERLKKVTFVEVPKKFEDEVGEDKMFLIPLIPTNDENEKPIKFIFKGE